MKLILKIALVVFLVGFTSCRDTKKEEESKQAVEQLNEVEASAEEISDNLEAEEKELQEALKELDSI